MWSCIWGHHISKLKRAILSTQRRPFEGCFCSAGKTTLFTDSTTKAECFSPSRKIKSPYCCEYTLMLLGRLKQNSFDDVILAICLVAYSQTTVHATFVSFMCKRFCLHVHAHTLYCSTYNTDWRIMLCAFDLLCWRHVATGSYSLIIAVIVMSFGEAVTFGMEWRDP